MMQRILPLAILLTANTGTSAFTIPSPPTFKTRLASSTQDNLPTANRDINMQYVLIIHEVENYPKWQKGFDRAALLRKDAGEIEYQVLKYENDDNKIVHFSKWECVDKAKAFFESEELEKIRRELGVKAPEFIYLDELERGVL